MDYKRKTEELNSITIGRVAALLGITLSGRNTSRCPFEDHDDKTPSFTIFNSDTRWKCFGCNRSGGAIDLVKFHLGLSFVEAKRWLLDRSGNSIPVVPFRPTKKKLIHPPADPHAPEKLFSDVYSAFIQSCSLSEDGMSYLLSRGISKKTVSEFDVTQLLDAKACLSSLLKQFGFASLQQSGLLSSSSTSRNPKLVFTVGDLIFPYKENGIIVYLQARCIECAGKRRWKNLSGISMRVFNVDVLQRKNVETIHICEGVMDTLSAHELGKKAVGLMGVSARLPLACIQVLKNKNVQILFDWDDAGERAASLLQAELLKHGVASSRPLNPLKVACDLNDYLRVKRKLP